MELILIISGIICIIVGLGALYNIPNEFIKEFEKSCYEYIEKRDRGKE